MYRSNSVIEVTPLTKHPVTSHLKDITDYKVDEWIDTCNKRQVSIVSGRQ